MTCEQYIEFVGMDIICLHTKFHMPSTPDSLVITIKMKTKYRLHAATMLFYILHKIILTHFQKAYYHTPLWYAKQSGTSVNSISQVHLSVILLLLIV